MTTGNEDIIDQARKELGKVGSMLNGGILPSGFIADKPLKKKLWIDEVANGYIIHPDTYKSDENIFVASTVPEVLEIVHKFLSK